MILLRQIFNLLDLIFSESSAPQIAGGIVLGMLFGLNPAGTLHWFLFFALFFVLRVNLFAAVVSAAVFIPIGFCLDPLFHPLGYYVLTLPAAQRVFAWGFHSVFLPYTRFSNSVVMGSLLCSVILCAPLYFFAKKLVLQHGARLWYRLKQSFAGRVWLTSRLYRLYVQDNPL